ncbi:MAG: DUF362 domain-containing protein [Armatimonadota bacterium]
MVLSRAERVLIPPGWTAPERFYPQGRLDFAQVQMLLNRAIEVHMEGEDRINPWRGVVSPNDVVGIQVDMHYPPVSPETINAVIDAVIGSGVKPNNVVVFAASEKDLFSAGIALNPRGRGVRTMGADSEGFRNDISRIVVDYCTAIINVGRLRVDKRFGMRGCLAACTVSLPETERAKLRKNPAHLGKAAANAVSRKKIRLNILEAYQPVLKDTGEKLPPVWEYRGLLMSNDPVAVDTIGARILNQKLQQAAEEEDRSSLPETVWDYLYTASTEYRLGNADPDTITVELVGPAIDLLLDTETVESTDDTAESN